MINNIEELKFENDKLAEKIARILSEQKTDYTPKDIDTLRSVFSQSLIDNLFNEKKVVSNDKIKNLFIETERMRAIELAIIDTYYKLLSDIQADSHKNKSSVSKEFNEWYDTNLQDIKLQFNSIANESFDIPKEKTKELVERLDSLLAYHKSISAGLEARSNTIKEELKGVAGEITKKFADTLKERDKEDTNTFIEELEQRGGATIKLLEKLLYGGIGAVCGSLLMIVLMKIA